MNQLAIYLAEYGLNNCSGLTDVKVSFGRVREFQDIDTGRGYPYEALEVIPNFGL